MEEIQHNKTNYWAKAVKISSGILAGLAIVFLFMILLLRWVNPPFTAFTLQENWEALNEERYSLRQNWVPGAQLPDHLKLAVIASEDQRFYAHWGLDLQAIDKALEEKERNGRVRGASTITQQVAKNLFLNSSRSYFRKAVEAGIAVLIEIFWTKERILEVYLNTSEFGPGMFGVNVASQFYYGKSASRLTSEESAKMATVLPNPKLIEPKPASEYVQNRSRWILRNMEQLSGRQYLPKSIPKPDSLSSPQDTVHISTNSDSLQPAWNVDSLSPVIFDSVSGIE